MELIIEIPWPDKCLSPNGGQRHNPNKIARLRKEAKQTAWASTVQAMGATTWTHRDGLIDIHAFYTNLGGAKSADDDNLIAQLKSSRDGVADALGIDDRCLRVGRVVFHIDRHNPRIVLVVGPRSDA